MGVRITFKTVWELVWRKETVEKIYFAYNEKNFPPHVLPIHSQAAKLGALGAQSYPQLMDSIADEAMVVGSVLHHVQGRPPQCNRIFVPLTQGCIGNGKLDVIGPFDDLGGLNSSIFLSSSWSPSLPTHSSKHTQLFLEPCYITLFRGEAVLKDESQ